MPHCALRWGILVEEGRMKVLEPITIKGMELRNRVVMAPMGVVAGYRGRHAVAYYTERAKGGVGAIIVAPQATDLLVSDDIWNKAGAADEFAMGQRRLTDSVHQFGAKIGGQIIHYGRIPPQMALWGEDGEQVAPSAVKGARALTLEEIEHMTENYIKASVKIREAGYDFVEFHVANGYLPNQFFSPVFNRRSDRYGGNLQGRMRFALDCLIGMRKALGDDYPISVRLGARSKKLRISLTDAAEIASQLEQAGADIIHVTTAEPTHVNAAHNPRPGRWTSTFHYGMSPAPGSCYPMGVFVDLAAAVKQRVHVPVITVGRMHNIELIEQVLSDGKADLIALGRQLICDPHWVNKVKSGELDAIAPCLSCNNCIEASRTASDPRCTVNASVGREQEYELQPAETRKRVLVVGSGPAGMEAAATAAARGHEATIYEKSSEPGKKLLYAAHPPQQKEIISLRNYLVQRLKKAGVVVRGGVKVDSKLVEEADADIVIIATGASSWIPNPLRKMAATLLSPATKWWGIKRIGKRGREPDNKLARELEGKVPSLLVIGDAVEPRAILEAIDDGARVGREI